MLGGAAFLADSVLTPAVSISSAVEGLKTLPALEHLFTENKDLTMMITAVIIVILFAVQSRGTESIGKVFGSVVMVWFAFLAIVGVVAIGNDWSVLAALNPYYGIKFLFSPNNATGLALMGTVFLSTTGAEALYSDMGHVGRGNIYFTWPFIKVALVLNYFGQGAWMLRNQNNPELADAEGINPFFQMMDPNVRYVAVETTDEPFTREYSVESFGTDYLFRVRIRLGFKVSQSIPAYLHQIMHDLEKTGELPNQQSIYPKLDADPGIGTIRYVVIHKALMPESKVSGRGALSLQIKYAIRRVAGSPVKWFGLAPYNPLVEVQPLFVSTRRPPRLTRVASQAPKREG